MYDDTSQGWGTIMRVMSLVRVALLAGAVVLPASFSAADAKVPPGACAFGKKVIAATTVCSYQCDPKTMWCSQQLCVNGALTPVLPCYSGFCTAKCGG
jgi:hypothetical protein